MLRSMDMTSDGVVPACGTRHVSTMTVNADDDVDLHVEIDEAPGADLTVVFCHGYLLSLESWTCQREALRGMVDQPARLVFWDHRGHGDSGWRAGSDVSLDRLGRDLYAVLRAVVPGGRIVLVGHSMGAMTILALAAAHPELFAARVAGVVLCGGSAGDLASVTAGIPRPMARLVHRAIPLALGALRLQPALVDTLRRALAGPSMALTGRFLVGGPEPETISALVTRLISRTPVEVIGRLWPALVGYDGRDGLAALTGIPVRVVVGSRDRITPVEHSALIAAAVPDAELTVLPGAGHLAILESPEEISLLISRLIRSHRRRRPHRGPVGRPTGRVLTSAMARRTG